MKIKIAAIVIPIIVAFAVIFFMPLPHSEAGSSSSPSEQYPGHIDPRNMHDGVTAVKVTVDGRLVNCVIAGGWGRDASWALSCDWNS